MAGFTECAIGKCLDGCPTQLVEVFSDDAGITARVAAGMAQLPLDGAFQAEMTVALHDWPQPGDGDFLTRC